MAKRHRKTEQGQPREFARHAGTWLFASAVAVLNAAAATASTELAKTEIPTCERESASLSIQARVGNVRATLQKALDAEPEHLKVRQRIAQYFPNFPNTFPNFMNANPQAPPPWLNFPNW